ncbi:hypothetical protein DCC62_07585 [candidate division KSB1 bacterium]|nr:MAG: hypothetical protein DCC62_07585 [candidate division KSB1 bacterium]
MNKNWFEFITGYAQILKAGYQLAGQFEHNTLVGDVREYFVSMFLSKILPDAMGVGSGEIIDRNGNRSKQIDVIIYNKNFPVLKVMGGKSIFPIESVVATIEVKSTLDGKLVEALDNCKSVTDLYVSVQDTPVVRQQLEAGGIEFEWAYPATYIFGYKHYATHISEFTDVVEKWGDSYYFNQNEKLFGVLSYPTMIVTEGCLSIRVSKRIPIAPVDNCDVVFAATKTDFRLHVFICDLLNAITRRTFLFHPSLQDCRFGMESYFDTIKLIDERIHFGSNWHYIYRKF